MAGADYDGIEGIFRIAKAGEKLDTFAIEVLTFHAAIEHELEVVLRKLLPHPDKILSGKPKLSFPHKVRLLASMWQKDPNDADKLCVVLKAFEDLRNEVAHPSGPSSLKTHKAKLVQAYREIAPNVEEDPSLLEIAQGVSMFIADGGTLEEFMSALKGLDELVNIQMPRVLSTRRRAGGGDGQLP